MSDTQLDLIAIGDSTIDTFIKVHDASVECDLNKQSFSLNKKDCKLCVPYGAKIPVDTIAYAVAGNAANVALGSSHLGLKTAIYTNLGDDDQGQTIKKEFERGNVSDDYIVLNKNKTSNLSVVLTFQGERTIFVYHQNWSYHLPDLAAANWVYLTSMSQTFVESNIMDEVCHYVEKSKAKLVFGPGTYQLKADIKRFPRVLEQCYLLIVNREEAQQIIGGNAGDFTAERDILSKLLFLGPKIVVVTDGVEGSWATDGQKFYKVGVVKCDVVEKTGAGDAYSTGLIRALASGEELGEAMIWGTINSASVISKVGPRSGMLTKDTLVTKRAEMKDFKASSV